MSFENAFKRALVVDDSKLARVALKRLLQEHAIEVEFAESGEQALEFLDREVVDVVFMDHHMPGMDGLEAVAAIKKNPRTATIPVMMYTTREGEVYVSQARALGAVGVLPKQVQPGVLFEMLLELGLVAERRNPAEEPATAEDQSVAYEVDRRVNDEVQGIAVQAVVTRILEDQHLSLRADILRGHREFARQVATEILAETRPAPIDAATPDLPAQPDLSAAEIGPRRYSQGVVTFLVLLLLVPALVLGGLYLEVVEERDAAELKLAALSRTMEERLQVAETVTSSLLVDMNQERGTNLEKHLAALAWSMSEGSSHSFNRQAFDNDRLKQLITLLNHLQETGFRGVVRLSSHLGEFCMTSDRLGNLAPAAADLVLETCATIGHPLDGSSFVDERQSPEFAAFMESRPARAGGIAVELVAHDRFSSTRRYPFPEEAPSAGVWNAVASRNHRVEFEFVPALELPELPELPEQ